MQKKKEADIEYQMLTCHRISIPNNANSIIGSMVISIKELLRLALTTEVSRSQGHLIVHHLAASILGPVGIRLTELQKFLLQGISFKDDDIGAIIRPIPETATVGDW